MSALRVSLPDGDPRKDRWSYPDLAVVFGLGARKLRDRMHEWEGQGFPVPLPWVLRPKMWNPAAVLAWKARRERAIGAVPAELQLVEGGRG